MGAISKPSMGSCSSCAIVSKARSNAFSCKITFCKSFAAVDLKFNNSPFATEPAWNLARAASICFSLIAACTFATSKFSFAKSTFK